MMDCSALAILQRILTPATAWVYAILDLVIPVNQPNFVKSQISAFHK
jgi:hypothetical protein